MSKLFNIHENGIYMVWEISDEQDVRLLHLSAVPFNNDLITDETQRRWHRMVDIQVTGEDQDDHHGSKHTGTMPGGRLKYQGDSDTVNNLGRKLEIEQGDDSISVTSHFQFYSGIPVVRSWTEVKNTGDADMGLEYVTSFALTGIDKEGLSSWEKKSELYIPYNAWHGEFQWQRGTLPEFGLSPVNIFSVNRIAYSSTGTWSCSNYLPMGCYENTEAKTVLCWQIENDGSWAWELSSTNPNRLYLQLSGPTENENHWWKNLKPGETFVSATAAVCVVNGGIEAAFQEMTHYRRVIRRPNKDNIELPIVFNDYMNCLFAEPTAELEVPLIDAAARIGCEYYVIDAGWYSAGFWWDTVGEWLPSIERFPEGIEATLAYIRSKGMVPGLWLELEVVGVNSPIASRVPDNWFFMRHGKRVIDHGRYQLDYRNPEVIAHANSVVDRLVKDYGVGYIKMDYNINAGTGTQIDSDSFGDGLLQHNRAYNEWLSDVFARYPELVIEACASGGMRATYGLLDKHSIQSTSDQTDYIKTSAIAGAALTAITPEQAGIWSYPLKDSDKEAVIYNMINAMLMRVNQSGRIDQMTDENLSLVKEALDVYKSIRKYIPESVPFWPIKVPRMGDGWISLGLQSKDRAYIAVWRLESSEATRQLPVKCMKGKNTEVRCAYPSEPNCVFEWDAINSVLNVKLPERNMARFFEVLVK